MRKDQIANFVGDASMNIVDVMSKIDQNTKGILFILDEYEKLTGCVTDGDIRRWLIRTGDLSASVKEAMTVSPKYIFSEEREKAEKIMRQEEIRILPVLNRRRRIIDLVFLSEHLTESEQKNRQDLTGVPVVIMAGGEGTRLYPYTKILPKPLIPIGDTPIVERIINCFVAYGIDHYYMTVNYKKGMIKSYFSEQCPDYHIEYVEEEKPLGTAGGIRLIRERFEKPVFVTNSDALILANYGDIYDYHLNSHNKITIVSALKNIVVPYGVLHARENGEIIHLEEKPKHSYFVNTGMYVLDSDVIEKIPKQTFYHMTHLVDAVMRSGEKVGMYPVSEDSFLDMGEFGEMKRMEEKLQIATDW